MLLIQTALHAEARAIIDYYGLKREHREHAFACFTADNVCLVESGTGKTNAATAVGWLSARVAAKSPVWLNIGMAGHAEHPVGELLLVHRVEDESLGHRWYPPILVSNPPGTDSLMTLNSATQTYPCDLMVDMEASGFFTAASRFTSMELIHSLKIISDNRQHPPTRMKPARVEALISPHMQTIDHYGRQLVELSAQLDDPARDEYQQLLQKFRFSTYQQHSLRRLLQRYHALYPDTTALQAMPPTTSSAKGMLQWLTNQLDNAPVKF